MSKSLGNLVFVCDLLKVADARAIRLALLRHHYRAGFEWFDTDLDEGKALLRRCWPPPTAARPGVHGAPTPARSPRGAGRPRRRPRRAPGPSTPSTTWPAPSSPAGPDPGAPPSRPRELARLLGRRPVGAACPGPGAVRAPGRCARRRGGLGGAGCPRRRPRRPAAAGGSRPTREAGRPGRCSTGGTTPLKAAATGRRSSPPSTRRPTQSSGTGQGRLFDGLAVVPLASYDLRLRTDEVPDLVAGLAARYPSPTTSSSRRSRPTTASTGIDSDRRRRRLLLHVPPPGRAGGGSSPTPTWRTSACPRPATCGTTGRSASSGPSHFTILLDPADRKRAEALGRPVRAGLRPADRRLRRGRARPDRGRPAPQPRPAAGDPPGHLRPVELRGLRQRLRRPGRGLGVDRAPGLRPGHQPGPQPAGLPAPDVPPRVHPRGRLPAGRAVRAVVGPRGRGRLDGERRGGPGEGRTGSDGVLPEDWEFTTGGGEAIVRAYDESSSAMAFLAGQEGQGAPLDLLAAVGRAPGGARAPADYRVDQGLRAVYGAGLDQFEKDWNGGR